jgi:dTDP-4-dehydrorhamnose reductase
MRILVTGASGMLGATLVSKWQDEFDVWATGRHNFTGNPARKFMTFDLLNESYDPLLVWAEPTVIVHCAAMTNVDYCEEHPEQAMAVNAESVAKLLKCDPGARLIFISTDAVFPDGLHLASETEETSPANIYGMSKQAAERYIRDAGEPHVGIRTTIVGKNRNPSHRGFAEWIVQTVGNGGEITLFDDALFTPITAWHLADELQWVMENKVAAGILHLAGKEAISKYDFGMKVCAKLGLNSSLIRKGSVDEFNFRAKRSKDQTLNSNYYEQISGRSLPSMAETIDSVFQHFKESAHA